MAASVQVLNTMEKAGLVKKPKDEGFIGNTQRYLDALAGIKPGKKNSADERFSQLFPYRRCRLGYLISQLH